MEQAGASHRDPLHHVRPAGPEDIDRLFEWRNLPDIVAAGASRRAVSREEHATWLTRVLRGAETLQLICMLGGTPVGQIRLDRKGEHAILSIALLPEIRGRGHGRQFLRQATLLAFSKWPIAQVLAHVRLDNPRALAFFRAAGFSGDEVLDQTLVSLGLPRPTVVPHNRVAVDEVVVEAGKAVLATGNWAAGDQVEALESRLCAATGMADAVTLASGSSALQLALLGLGIRPGDRVIVPAYSCVAVPNAVLTVGGIPVSADVDPETCNITPETVKRQSRHPRIRAVVAVNTFGLPSPVAGIREATGLPVVEDCAHTFGIACEDGPVGGRSEASILSMAPTKLLGSIAGGALLTAHPGAGQLARRLRDYDELPASPHAGNHKANDVIAALALERLDSLPEILRIRARHAATYLRAVQPFVASGRVRLPPTGRDRIWYRFTVQPPRAAEPIIARLQRLGVAATKPVTCWYDEDASDHPGARLLFERLISLPLSPALTQAEVDRSASALIIALEEAL